MLSHPQEIRAFLEHHEITVKKDSPSRDIKKFFSRIYKSNSRQEANRDAPHIFAAITPIYLEVSNWDTCLYLLRCKYKVSVWFVDNLKSLHLTPFPLSPILEPQQDADERRGLAGAEPPARPVHS